MKSKARYCVNCGKKYYPNSYYAYPRGDSWWDGEQWQYNEVPNMHKRFHSQGCMLGWIAMHSLAFANLVDNISHFMIEDNKQPKERINNGS